MELDSSVQTRHQASIAQANHQESKAAAAEEDRTRGIALERSRRSSAGSDRSVHVRDSGDLGNL